MLSFAQGFLINVFINKTSKENKEAASQRRRKGNESRGAPGPVLLVFPNRAGGEEAGRASLKVFRMVLSPTLRAGCCQLGYRQWCRHCEVQVQLCTVSIPLSSHLACSWTSPDAGAGIAVPKGWYSDGWWSMRG